MVGVAQLVERWLVEPDVAGSSPVVHPIRKWSDLCPAIFFLNGSRTLVSGYF